MSGVSYEGHAVNVGDQISVMGGVQSITGNAPYTALVALQDLYGQAFTVHANDVTAALHALAPGAGVGLSMNGKNFDAGDRVTANGVVTSVSGTGVTAQVTVLLDHSGLSVVVNAGSCHVNQ